jgi:hypothetical protein
MDYLSYFSFSIIIYFSVYSILFCIIGIRALIIHKPTIINSKFRLILLSIAIIPIIIINILTLDIKLNFDFILPLALISVFIYYLFAIKGYNIFCVNDEDFRNAIIATLDKNNIRYEERMNTIELLEMNNQINVVYASWMGNGVIKIKRKMDKELLKKIINDIKIFHKENSITTKKTLGIFTLVFGLLSIVLSIGFIYLLF